MNFLITLKVLLSGTCKYFLVIAEGCDIIALDQKV